MAIFSPFLAFHRTQKILVGRKFPIQHQPSLVILCSLNRRSLALKPTQDDVYLENCSWSFSVGRTAADAVCTGKDLFHGLPNGWYV
jgi:hypothetical protein